MIIIRKTLKFSIRPDDQTTKYILGTHFIQAEKCSVFPSKDNLYDMS